MKVLAIGNSFSEDATRYLHNIAKSAGEKWKVVNIHIGGCSLRTHYINALEDAKKYRMEFNGAFTGFFVSIKDALISDNWDVVTIQQVSRESTNYDTYQPYLDFMVDYIKKYSPKSNIYVHQTWAYEDGSPNLAQRGYEKAIYMLNDIKSAYDSAAEGIKAEGIIRSGEAMYKLVEKGIKKVHRDFCHSSFGLGRYTLALMWYATLTGKCIDDIDFSDFDEPVSDEEIAIAKAAVKEVLN